MVTKISERLYRPDVENELNEAPENYSGLNFAYSAGIVYTQGGKVNVPAGTILMTDNAVNIVWIDYDTETIATATTGSEDTTNAVRLFSVTTLAGVITDVTDERAKLTEIII